MYSKKVQHVLCIKFFQPGYEKTIVEEEKVLNYLVFVSVVGPPQVKVDTTS